MMKVELLSEDAALDITQDARVAAIRWDLITGSVVLDLDCPISEAKNAPMQRAWLVFRGVKDMSIPLVGRLPAGCWLTTTMEGVRYRRASLN